MVALGHLAFETRAEGVMCSGMCPRWLQIANVNRPGAKPANELLDHNHRLCIRIGRHEFVASNRLPQRLEAVTRHLRCLRDREGEGEGLRACDPQRVQLFANDATDCFFYLCEGVFTEHFARLSDLRLSCPGALGSTRPNGLMARPNGQEIRSERGTPFVGRGWSSSGRPICSRRNLLHRSRSYG